MKDQFGNYTPGLVSVAETVTVVPGGGSGLSGAGVPSDSLGNSGDTYVDTDAASFYCKSGNTWILVFSPTV
jgi:hypothetical protein